MSITTVASRPAVTEQDEDMEAVYLEDDPDTAELYRLKLQLDGYHVRVLPMGSTPPAAIDDPLPHLFFVDTRWHPDLAMRTLAAWRADPRFRSIPAVIITNRHHGQWADGDPQLGPADHFLFLPEPLPVALH